MNDEQDRSYRCSAPGCSQRFQTEDHLMIHRHKHEMTLKFSSTKADPLADQTPTPTRFLRNCEEVGLFNEIEQEFRQAQEEQNIKQTQSLPQNGSSCVNQPQPHSQHQPQSHGGMRGLSCSMAGQQALPSAQSNSVITQAHSMLTHSGPVPGPLSSLLHLRNNRQRQPLAASMPGTLPDPAMQGASAQHMSMERQMSMGSSMMSIQGPAHNSSCSSPQRAKTVGHHHQHQHPGAVANGNMGPTMGNMIEMSPRQRHTQLQQQHHQQLQQAPPISYQQHCHAPPHHLGNAHSLGHQSGNVPHHPVHQSPPSHLQASHTHQTSPHLPLHSIAAQLSPAAQQMHSSQQTHSLHAGQATGGRRRRSVDQDPDERRQKFLERNRAAATRCRQKRKVWVSALEKKAEELTHNNMQLQNEVTTLRSEVGQLKQILLTHKDCPVSARHRESQGYLSPGSSTGSPSPLCPGSQQQAIQSNSISTSSAGGGDGAHSN
ncbi:cyclic AMP-responsive element-binding protein 5-like isoform X1 [Salvelinus namaycush]|uniref:Cyclic AMP-responsive element-binding protein 5-like isoform X1 n=1 Tax=Salvelinus namaycush TaxID=8040 RepID=A0A8U0PDC6_SALNM|nr:cyclic AMP-responsive element-binding protein 5-like isoform X1 [Salvelinus namaycush]